MSTGASSAGDGGTEQRDETADSPDGSEGSPDDTEGSPDGSENSPDGGEDRLRESLEPGSPSLENVAFVLLGVATAVVVWLLLVP